MLLIKQDGLHKAKGRDGKRKSWVLEQDLGVLSFRSVLCGCKPKEVVLWVTSAWPKGFTRAEL